MTPNTDKAAISIPEIVKQYVLDNCGRMPETQKEIDQYLDLINHAKEYADSLVISKAVGKRFMKKLGIKTPEQIKKDNPFK